MGAPPHMPCVPGSSEERGIGGWLGGWKAEGAFCSHHPPDIQLLPLNPNWEEPGALRPMSLSQ